VEVLRSRTSFIVGQRAGALGHAAQCHIVILESAGGKRRDDAASGHRHGATSGRAPILPVGIGRTRPGQSREYAQQGVNRIVVSLRIGPVEDQLAEPTSFPNLNIVH
jgi:hypothetical protein